MSIADVCNMYIHIYVNDLFINILISKNNISMYL